MQRQTLVKSLAVTFSHTQSVVLSAFEHLVEYDPQASVAGYESALTVGGTLLSDINNALLQAQQEGSVSGSRRDLAFLRQILPSLYPAYGLSGSSHHLILALFFMLNGHRLAPVLTDNALVYVARPPRYSSFSAQRSFLAELSNHLLANSTDRAFETVDALCTLFPADPLFFALTASQFFPASWVYMHFRPNAAALADKVTL